ncbi:MAG: hypothetical protein JWL60_2015 [Gemmatimonadetes bacterium]|nr:hypothetical protein [Gemmatimonadota bacterium]
MTTSFPALRHRAPRGDAGRMLVRTLLSSADTPRMPIRSHRALALALLAFVASCTDSPTGPRTGPVRQLGQLGVYAQSNALPASGTLVVQVSGPGIVKSDGTSPDTLAFNIPLTGGVATGSITVPAGPNRLIMVRAYDGVTETHRGSVTTDIVVGGNPTITVTLVPLVGDVTVSVSIGTTIVIVRPGVATLSVGDTLRMTAEIRDQNGGLVTGRVRWATLNPLRATVDTLGLVAMRDTGDVQIVATYGTVGGGARLSGIAVTSATAYQLTWNGSVSRNWSEANNWTPHGIGAARVPAATDSVVIPAGPLNQPILNFCAEQSVRDLVVQAAASITDYCGYGVNVYRTAVVRGTVQVPVYARPGVTVAGLYDELVVRGDSVSLADSVRAVSVEVNGPTASLRLAGRRLTVSGNLYVSTGTVTMGPGDTLVVAGNVNWSGSDHSGRLTGGVVLFRGTDFYGFRYKGTGTSRLVFDRSVAGVQTVSGFDFLSDPARAVVQRWDVRNVDGVRLCAHLAVTDSITIRTTGTAAAIDQGCGGYHVRANGPVVTDANTTVSSYLWELRHPTGTSLVAGPWRPSYTDVRVADALLTPSHPYQHLRLFASHRLDGNMTLAANLEVNGAGIEVDLNGHRLSVGGNVDLNAGALLKMTAAGDTMLVAGNANFNTDTRAAELTRLTAGLLEVRGVFYANGFNAAGTHRVRLTGTAANTYVQGSNFLSNDHAFQELELAGGAQIGNCGHTRVKGTLTLRTGATMFEYCGGYYLRIDGDLVTEAGSTVDPYLVQLYNATGTANVAGAFTPTYTQIHTALAAGQLKGGLGYTNMSVHAAASLPASLSVNGDMTVTGPAASLALNGHTLTVAGRLSVADNAILAMTNAADSLVLLGPATWSGGGNHAGRLTAGVMLLRGDSFCASNFHASGTHLTLIDRIGSPVRIDCVSGGTPQSTPFNRVVVRGYGVLLSCHLYAARGVRVVAGARVEQNCGSGNLWVTDTLVTEPGSAVVNGASYPGSNQLGVVLGDSSGTAAVAGTFTPHVTYFSALHANIKRGPAYRSVRIDRSTTLLDSLTFDGDLDLINDGTILTLGGHRLEVRNSMDLANTAVVKMTEPGDTLLVATGNEAATLFWDGGDQTGLLTNGVVLFKGARFYGLRYKATAPNRFVFTGIASGAPISVEGAPTFGRLELAGTRTVNLNDRATVLDTLRISTATQLIGGTQLVVGAGSGTLVTVPGSDVSSIPNVYLDGPSGTRLVQGRFRPANTWLRAATPEVGALKPGLEYQSVHLEGPYELAQSMSIGGNLTVNASIGELRMNGLRLTVGGSANITSGARLTMSAAAESLLVAGHFDLQSAAGISTLSAGVITVAGDYLYMQRGGSGASGTHTFVMNGAGVGSQNIYAGSSGGTHDIRNLVLAGSRTVNFISPVRVSGNMQVVSPTSVSAASLRVGGSVSTVAGSRLAFTGPFELMDGSGTSQVMGGFRNTGITRFLGNSATILVRGGPDSVSYGTVELTGAGTVTGGPLQLPGALTLATAASSLTLPDGSSFGGRVATDGLLTFAGGATGAEYLLVNAGGTAVAAGTVAPVDFLHLYTYAGGTLDNLVGTALVGFRYKSPGGTYTQGGSRLGPAPSVWPTPPQ